jgi:transposase-like protein
VATRRHFTQEYKDQAVSLVLNSGRTIAEVAKSIGVHETACGAPSGQPTAHSQTSNSTGTHRPKLVALLRQEREKES